MKVRVYPMRKRGRHLSWREIENGPSFVGTLTSYSIKQQGQSYNAVTLNVSAPTEGKPLPDLYEPALVRFAPNAFVIRGYERLETPEGVVGVVQEWQCRDS